MGRKLLVNRRLAFADRRAARGEHETVHAAVPAGFEIIERAEHVDGAVARRVGDRRPDPGIGGQMDDRVSSGDDAARQRCVADVAGHDLDAASRAAGLGRFERLGIERHDRADHFEIGARADRKVVDDADRVVAPRQQQPDKIAADEAAAAGDEPAHR
jgi:hypothetical protein